MLYRVLASQLCEVMLPTFNPIGLGAHKRNFRARNPPEGGCVPRKLNVAERDFQSLMAEAEKTGGLHINRILTKMYMHTESVICREEREIIEHDGPSLAPLARGRMARPVMRGQTRPAHTRNEPDNPHPYKRKENGNNEENA